MASQSLTSRLQALADTYKHTLTLIQRLQKLPSTPGTYSNSDGDPRLELSSEIHQSLKEQGDELEALRQEIGDDASNYLGGYVGGGSVRRRNSEQVQERERTAAIVVKLEEDLKSARASFRKAQLEAKRNADAAKRRERELLFANRTKDADGQHPPARRKGQEKLTQDELALNASSDVTAALRRTHTLLQSNLEQSQFAQQTLDESSEALASLSENYAGLESLLRSSGGLVRQLIRSNKSDTWYLTTAFYLLVVTLAWLCFRRLLYGPLWWLVWQPLKLMWWLFVTTLASVGIVGSQPAASGITSMPQSTAANAVERPTWPAGGQPAYVPVGAKGGGWEVQRPQKTLPADDSGRKEKSLVDQVGEEIERNSADEMQGGIHLKERDEDDGPPNPKKRMFEQERDGPVHTKDEL